MLRFGMVSSLPVHDAAYGGYFTLQKGLTSTGPMPTLPARMIAFLFGGNEIWNWDKRKNVVRRGNNLGIRLSAGTDAHPQESLRLRTGSWAVPLVGEIALG
jgi:hypothetical protein